MAVFSKKTAKRMLLLCTMLATGIAANGQEETIPAFSKIEAKALAPAFRESVEQEGLTQREVLKSTDISQTLKGFTFDGKSLFSSFTEGPKAIPQDGIISTVCRLLSIYISDYQTSDATGAIRIYGASRRARQTYHFEGEIRIKKVIRHYFGGMGADSASNVLIASYQFREDPQKEGSGVYSGTYAAQINTDISYNYLDNTIKREVTLDRRENSSPYYYNRCFVGCWTSYATGVSLPAIWGDDRLPFTSQWFDVGNEHLVPAEEYTDNEWEEVLNGSRLEPYYNEDGEPMGWRCKDEWWTKY